MVGPDESKMSITRLCDFPEQKHIDVSATAIMILMLSCIMIREKSLKRKVTAAHKLPFLFKSMVSMG